MQCSWILMQENTSSVRWCWMFNNFLRVPDSFNDRCICLCCSGDIKPICLLMHSYLNSKSWNCSACTSVWEIVTGWRQQVDLFWRSGSQPGKSDGTVKGFATFAININTWWQLKSLPISSEETDICEGVSESPLSLNGLLWLLPNNLQCSRTWPWWSNHDDPLISDTLKLSIR